MPRAGWEHIQEIQFKLSNEDHTAFLRRYVASENKVYVEDPDNPGVFLPGVTPGPGAPSVTTRFVTLEAGRMSITAHGAGSAALDIRWVLIFQEPALNQQYVQSLNILYDDGQATGFFDVGRAVGGQELFLPLVTQATVRK
jgi:hypothetical protein